MVEKTSKRPSEIHALGMLEEGQAGYIEGMEVAGGRQLVADAELMPADGPWDDLVKLGFGKPEPSGDPLFVRTTLPAGWRKAPTPGGDGRGSEVLDERGIMRVTVWYKAAFYDRRADCHIVNVGAALAGREIWAEPGEPDFRPPGLHPQWDQLTIDERDAYMASLDRYLADAQQSPDLYGDRVERVKALRAAVLRKAGMW